MGLDQYVYLCRKCSPEEIRELEGKTTTDARDVHDLYVFVIDDEIKDATKTMEPYLSEVNLLVHNVNWDKILADNHVPDDYQWSSSSYSNDTLITTYRPPDKDVSDDEKITLALDMSEIDRIYGYDELTPCYVMHAEEIHYWRKAYDVDDEIAEHFPHGKCHYIALNEDAIFDLMDISPDFRPPMLRPGEVLCYHPWW